MIIYKANNSDKGILIHHSVVPLPLLGEGLSLRKRFKHVSAIVNYHFYRILTYSAVLITADLRTEFVFTGRRRSNLRRTKRKHRKAHGTYAVGFGLLRFNIQRSADNRRFENRICFHRAKA